MNMLQYLALWREVQGKTVSLRKAFQFFPVARWQGSGDKSLLMLRDSFGVALAPFVTAHYGDSTVLHGSATTVDVLNEQLSFLPDMVVLEATERFSENLLSQARTLLAWLEQ